MTSRRAPSMVEGRGTMPAPGEDGDVAGSVDGGAAGGMGEIGGRPEAGDITFGMGRPRPSLAADVGIDAVLFPLFGRVADPAQRHPQALRLVGLWRDRVAELVRNDWDPSPGGGPAATARRVRQLRNCSPPFLAAHPPSSCGLSPLCPFCWAREAMRIWAVADAVFFPKDSHSGRRPERSAFGLVETARTHRLPGEDPRLLASFLADRVRRPPRGAPVGPFYRPHEIATYPALGAYETVAVSSGPGEPWEVAIRQVLAVAPAHVGLLQPPPYRRIRIRLTRHDGPDRRDLARAVARLCRYPPWLLRGDPGRVLGALSARAGLRLGAAFGNFRGARPAAGPPPIDGTERIR